MTEPFDVRDFALAHPREPRRVVRGRVTVSTSEREPRPAVIVVHGFKGFSRWGFFPELQRRIAAEGWTSIAINLSGSGVGEDLESFTEDEAFFRSTPSRDQEDLEALRAAIDAGGLPTPGVVDTTRLALFGHSRGGGSVLLHAERRGDYRAVVTWSSVAASNRFDEDTQARWRRTGVLEVPNARTGQIHRMSVDFLDDVERHADALDIVVACRRSHTPTLLVHGTDDEAVPFEEALTLLDAFEPGVAELVKVEGAGHTFGAVHPFAGTTPELDVAMISMLDFLRHHLNRESS